MSTRLNFWLRCTVLTGITLLCTFCVERILKLQFFKLLFPETVALSDFEYTDFAFLLRPTPKPDTNIVLVNIGQLGRAGMAKQIQAINRFNPKVLGFDVIFSSATGAFDTDSMATQKIKKAIQESNSLVLAKSLLQTDSAFNSVEAGKIYYDSVEGPNGLLKGITHEAYANLYSLDYGDYFLGGTPLKIARSFVPQYRLNGEINYALSVKIAYLFDSLKTRKFLNRDKQVEHINFRGNVGSPDAVDASWFYRTIDFDQVTDSLALDSLGKYLSNKIALFGYMGNDLYDIRHGDMFFTPLNSVPLGKSLPDMYGAVVHANIISMILNEDYIDTWSVWAEYLFAFVVCLLHVAALLWLQKRFPKGFDWLALLLIFIQLVLIATLRLELFYQFNLKVELTVALGSMAVAGFVVNQANHFLKNDLPLKSNQPVL